MQLTRFDHALIMATKAHAGINDKGGRPYILHPVGVASLAVEYGLDEDDQISAVLHDTVEDTEMTLGIIRANFGATVEETVDALSRRWLSPMKKESYDDFIARLCEVPRARRLKLLDIFHNTLPSRWVKGIKGLYEGRYAKARRKIMDAMDMNNEIDKAFIEKHITEIKRL
jgi:(p)ppGpp synthase/HD superfamily hydrolase